MQSNVTTNWTHAIGWSFGYPCSQLWIRYYLVFLYLLKLGTRVQVYWCDNYHYYYIKVMCSGFGIRLPYLNFPL